MRSATEWKNHIAQKYFAADTYDQNSWAEKFEGTRDKIVVHIPARCGSSRLVDKNIRPLCGVPLLAYTILIAKALPVNRVIVNTDSPIYAKIAERYGAEVPFLRPKELAGNYVPPGAAFFYAFMHLASENYPLSIAIDMYPTTPFRNVAIMREYLRMTKEEGHCLSIFSPDYDAANLYRKSEKLITGSAAKRINSVYQYKQTSNFIGFKVNSNEIKTSCYVGIKNIVELMDIDCDADMKAVEYIVENGLYDFGIDIC